MKTKVKKIIPYCLILIILIGLLSPMIGVRDARAQEPVAPIGKCLYGDDVNGYKSINITKKTLVKKPLTLGLGTPHPHQIPLKNQKQMTKRHSTKNYKNINADSPGLGVLSGLDVSYGLFTASFMLSPRFYLQ